MIGWVISSLMLCGHLCKLLVHEPFCRAAARSCCVNTLYAAYSFALFQGCSSLRLLAQAEQAVLHGAHANGQKSERKTPRWRIYPSRHKIRYRSVSLPDDLGQIKFASSLQHTIQRAHESQCHGFESSTLSKICTGLGSVPTEMDHAS